MTAKKPTTAEKPTETALAEHSPQKWEAMIDVVRQVAAPGANDAEFAVFVYQAKRTGLDPLARQVYCLKIGGKISTQAGIDGFRVIAERTGKYRGQEPRQWCGDDGVWKDVWTGDKPPVAARVGIIRSDFDKPIYGVAHYREYVVEVEARDEQGKNYWRPNYMWDKMAAGQLAKCAEALGLRIAFPQDLSGIYTADEMEQAQSRQRAGNGAGAGADEEVLDSAKFVNIQQAAEKLGPTREVLLATIKEKWERCIGEGGYRATPKQEALYAKAHKASLEALKVLLPEIEKIYISLFPPVPEEKPAEAPTAPEEGEVKPAEPMDDKPTKPAEGKAEGGAK